MINRAEKIEEAKNGEPLTVEVLPDFAPERRPEVKPESSAAIQEQIERIKNEITEVELKLNPVSEADLEERQQKIKDYQERYTPKYLAKKGMTALAKTVTFFATKGEKFNKEGEENIPEKGPYIVICNHWGDASGIGDSMSLMRTFKRDSLHLAVGKEIWFDKSPILKWLFEKMGTIPVEESLANLTDEQKEEALNRQGSNSAKKVFRKIIDNEKASKKPTNVDFIRQAVALLSRGDAVGVYPEGMWLDPQGPGKIREREELKQGYRGIELIARKYKELTGEELAILPTAFVASEGSERPRVVIGKPLFLSENSGEQNGTDWCMSYVAGMLPEEKRGYYKETAVEQ